eukprot:TRINITY_DN3976_c0_g2_i2.p1 TRINITY_DN3976_c0_g2~~TRINITY_DN3976_c0_g2_i2.p1  ORF type:complete len:151 (+),score=8.38 TRINITY_DN3976_c0_g2_i2:242-694(+)
MSSTRREGATPPLRARYESIGGPPAGNAKKVSSTGIGEQRCREMVATVIDSPDNDVARMIRYLEKRRGCDALKNGIRCRPCHNMIRTMMPSSTGMPSAFYNSTNRQIVVCSNLDVDQKDVEESLLHELVHAIDSCRSSKFPRDCRYRACR